MNHMAKPIIVKKEGQDNIEFTMVINHNPLAEVDNSMFHHIDPATLISDSLQGGMYFAISFDVAKEILKTGKREIIVWLDLYEEGNTSWFKLKGSEPLMSLSTNKDSKDIMDLLGDDIITSLKQYDVNLSSYCYMFIRLN